MNNFESALEVYEEYKALKGKVEEAKEDLENTKKELEAAQNELKSYEKEMIKCGYGDFIDHD